MWTQRQFNTRMRTCSHEALLLAGLGEVTCILIQQCRESFVFYLRTTGKRRNSSQDGIRSGFDDIR
jgi:hypothetical protein